MDKQKHLRDKKLIYGRLRRYTPCSGRFISLVRTPRILGNIRTVEVDGQRVSVSTRRVEHILENYGWDAYNNLLGEE